ncbi:MAG: hypothetical protein K6E73_08150 [Bacteroidales bacterium]|nr:hypothetical protein [Bacteroidales bacterium]
MKQIFRLATVLLAIAAFAACSQTRTKQDVMADFEQLYVKTESSHSDFDSKDWQKYEKKLDELEAELSKFDFTASERITLNRLRVKHATLKAESKVKQAGESIKEAASEVSDIVKDAAEDAADAVKSITK